MNYAYSNGRKYTFNQSESAGGGILNAEVVDNISVILEDDGTIQEIEVSPNAPQPVVYGVAIYPISIYPMVGGWFADVYDVRLDKITIKQPWVSYSKNNYLEANIEYAETFPSVPTPLISPAEVKLTRIKDR